MHRQRRRRQLRFSRHLTYKAVPLELAVVTSCQHTKALQYLDPLRRTNYLRFYLPVTTHRLISFQTQYQMFNCWTIIHFKPLESCLQTISAWMFYQGRRSTVSHKDALAIKFISKLSGQHSRAQIYSSHCGPGRRTGKYLSTSNNINSLIRGSIYTLGETSEYEGWEMNVFLVYLFVYLRSSLFKFTHTP